MNCAQMHRGTASTGNLHWQTMQRLLPTLTISSRSHAQIAFRFLLTSTYFVGGRPSCAASDRVITFDDLLTDAGVRRIAATDLQVVAKDLEAWIEHDWIAVIHIGADRENLEGPLPPFPDIPSRGTD